MEKLQQGGNMDTLETLEHKCLVYLKMKQYEKVVQDGKTLLQLQHNHPVAFKCILVALCKMNQLQQVSDVLKVWQTTCPNNLQMIECRTKLEGLIQAVSRGIDSSSAFSNVEELLGLNSEWLQRRRVQVEEWKYRPLPQGRNSFVLCLQHRFGHCSLGPKCPDAHGQLELEEWKTRSVAESSLMVENSNGRTSPNYIQNLLRLLGEAGDETRILSEDSSSIKIKCVEPLNVTISSRKMRNYHWKFVVESKEPLLHVCLLHEIHRQYFQIDSAFLHGSGHNKLDLRAPNSNTENVQVLNINLNPEISSNMKGRHYTYSVDITFSPQSMGNFRQTVVFDFGLKQKLVRNISVEVSPPSDDDAFSTSNENQEASRNSRSTSPSEEQVMVGTRGKSTWNYGNADIVNGSTGSRVSSDKVGFALINGMVKHNVVVEDKKEVLTKENYKDRMRFFLTEEERARQEIISKYNVTTLLKISNQYSMASGYFEGECKYAVDGGLFGRMTLFRDISEDTAVGRLILRSCNCVLLTKTNDANKTTGKPRVYWSEIGDKTKNAIYIQLGQTCVRELGLKNEDSFLFDIQFQLDRSAFMEQKKVIDRLTDVHLQMLFPDFNDAYNIPWSPMMQWDGGDGSGKARLNPKQKESLIAVTSENSGSGVCSPILLIGPFGTGKTYTLAQCIKKLLMQPSSRIMICTQSNSAADLYIKEYLDSWVSKGLEAARPLRIYYCLRSFKTVHPTVLKYCIKENGRFRNPTKEDILTHRVIVVTLATSYLLMDLNLGADCFSHILLDEAAQAMESEAITPLMSAGPGTKLVLAGDHMQLSPELFCEHAKNFHSSLLERLHCLYPESHPCKLMLCENYRSHAAIIQFASDSFYGKKLECGMHQPAHRDYYPLTFFAARGEDVQDPDSTSYFNMAEVFEVAEKVSELISSWPSEWGDFRDENAIGVFTPYADQVSKIRARLRRKGLTFVSVERVLNVQGKQFRVVFLSTVRTHKPWLRILPESVGKEVDLGFFSNPKLLNTALTRAQSLVCCIGDPVSLCSVGKCRVLWEDYIRVCHENGSLFGITYGQLKQNIVGVELRLTWGFNPLASEFEPKMSINHDNNNSTSQTNNHSIHNTNTISAGNNFSTMSSASYGSNTASSISSSGSYSRSSELTHASNSTSSGMVPVYPAPSSASSSYYAGQSINLAGQGQQQQQPPPQQQPQHPLQAPIHNNISDANYQIIRPTQQNYRYVPVPVPVVPQQATVVRAPYPYVAQNYAEYGAVATPIAAVGNSYPNMIVHPSVATNPYLAAQVALQQPSALYTTSQYPPNIRNATGPTTTNVLPAQTQPQPQQQIPTPYNNSYSVMNPNEVQQIPPQSQIPTNTIRGQEQLNTYRNYPNHPQQQQQQQQQQPQQQQQQQIKPPTFAADIARYQSNLNPQAVSGLPLYRRSEMNPTTSNMNYPSQEQIRQQQHQQVAQVFKQAASAGNVDNFSHEEKEMLKRILEVYSSSGGDPGGIDFEDLKSLRHKLGVLSVSENLIKNNNSGSIMTSHINHGLPASSTEINMLEYQQHQQQLHQQQRHGVSLESAAMALANKSVLNTSSNMSGHVPLPPSSLSAAHLPHPNWFPSNSSSVNSSSGGSTYNSSNFLQREQQQLTYNNSNGNNPITNISNNPSHNQLQSNMIPQQSYRTNSTNQPSYITQQHPHHHLNTESNSMSMVNNGDAFGNLSVFQVHAMKERRGPLPQQQQQQQPERVINSTTSINNDSGSFAGRSYANVVKQTTSQIGGGNMTVGNNTNNIQEPEQSSQYVTLFPKNNFSRNSLMNPSQRITLDKTNYSPFNS